MLLNLQGTNKQEMPDNYKELSRHVLRSWKETGLKGLIHIWKDKVSAIQMISMRMWMLSIEKVTCT